MCGGGGKGGGRGEKGVCVCGEGGGERERRGVCACVRVCDGEERERVRERGGGRKGGRKGRRERKGREGLRGCICMVAHGFFAKSRLPLSAGNLGISSECSHLSLISRSTVACTSSLAEGRPPLNNDESVVELRVGGVSSMWSFFFLFKFVLVAWHIECVL